MRAGKLTGAASGGTPFWRDHSFSALLDRCSALARLSDHLPAGPGGPGYRGQERIEDVQSSYKDHDYGLFFYALTRAIKPRTCVELGVLNGYSLLSIAAALRDNGAGYIQGIDLFEDYPHRHARFADVETLINTCRLGKFAGIKKTDALSVDTQHEEIDFLHVDLSNDGDTYRFVFKHWAGKVNRVILLEGGSADRDQVEWMVKHKKPPIVPAVDEIRRAFPNWTIAVLAPFPSLTVALRSAPDLHGHPYER